MLRYKPRILILAFLVMIAAALPVGYTDAFSFGFGDLFDKKDSAEVAQAKVAAEVQAALEGGAKGELVEVLVFLTEQTDTTRVAVEAVLAMPARATEKQKRLQGRRAVVEALQQRAEISQAPLLNLIRREEARGRVTAYRAYYIVNLIYVEATADVIELLARETAVAQILPNREIEPIEREQFSLYGPDALAEAGAEGIEWNIERIGAPAVWNAYGFDGSGVVVGIIDSGVMWNHEALKEQWRGYDPNDPDNPDPVYNWFDALGDLERPWDGNGHGTFVAGIILGRDPGGINRVGVAPGANWIAARAFDESGSGTTASVLAAGEYMLAPTDAEGIPNSLMAPDIINNSWGLGAGDSEIYRAMVQAWRSAGILPVFSAGNDGSDGEATVAVPASYPESIAVGATGRYNNLMMFSSRGPGPFGEGVKPDLSAPGFMIRSSSSSFGYKSGGWGTSYAAPHVSGVAALLLAAESDLSPAELEDLLITSADSLTDSNYPEAPNYGYGYGLINAYSAVTFVVEGRGLISGRVVSGEPGAEPLQALIKVQETGRRVYSDADGYFSFYHGAAAGLTLQVELYAFQQVEILFDLDPAESLELGDIVLQLKPTGSIRGQVVDSISGDALPGARVTLPGDPNYTAVLTDSGGGFGFDNLPAGDYELRVMAGSYLPLSDNITVSGGQEAEPVAALQPYRLSSNFNVDRRTGDLPLSVRFTDQSVGEPAGWAWYFGDEDLNGSWYEIAGAAPWAGRSAHSSVVLPDGSALIMGGYTGEIPWRMNDVWRTEDGGYSWTEVTANAGWPGRAGHSSVILPGGSIVISGGSVITAMLSNGWVNAEPANDVWRSDDNGATWQEVTGAAPWARRTSHSCVVMADGSIILIGGLVAGAGPANDVWRSVDQGESWQQVNNEAAWSPRMSHSSVVLPDDSILLMGGYDYTARMNDVWRSTDYGLTWVQVTSAAQWEPRSGHSSVILPDGSIGLLGGSGSARLNDVWRSADHGENWVEVSGEGTTWPVRQDHSSVVLPGGAILLAGGVGAGPLNSVWRLETAGSQEQNPLHIYSEPGTYQVSLQVYNASEYDGVSKSEYIAAGPPQYFIELAALPADGGTVSGGGYYGEGQSVIVTAAAAENWVFSCWSESGQIVSYDATYIFTADADRNLTANFSLAGDLEYDFTIGLSEGWNLLSLPRYFSEINYNNDDFEGWLAFENDQWVDSNIFALLNNPGKAVFIRAKRPTAISFIWAELSPGEEFARQLLNPGWNLISSGIRADYKTILADLRDEGEGGLTQIYAPNSFNGRKTGGYHLPWQNPLINLLAPDPDEGQEMFPFDGYWVYLRGEPLYFVTPLSTSPVKPVIMQPDDSGAY